MGSADSAGLAGSNKTITDIALDGTRERLQSLPCLRLRSVYRKEIESLD
jgi:hypothetical protein